MEEHKAENIGAVELNNAVEFEKDNDWIDTGQRDTGGLEVGESFKEGRLEDSGRLHQFVRRAGDVFAEAKRPGKNLVKLGGLEGTGVNLSVWEVSEQPGVEYKWRAEYECTDEYEWIAAN